MDKTNEEIKDGKEFAEFYIDLIENHKETLAYYLSENVILDWFGQTVKGIKNIGIFVKQNMTNIKHDFPNIDVCPKIGYRDSHIVKYSPRQTRRSAALRITKSEDKDKTPPNLVIPGCSKKREKGQGDGLHNCSDESPPKRTCLVGDVIETDNPTPHKVLNITSDGNIEFRRRSSKKYQRETKWCRPCKLQVAFSQNAGEYLIHLIIYQGNVKCRRNLMKDFDAAEVQ